MSVGGGASPEFEKRWADTISSYLADPNVDNARDVRKLAADFWRIRPGIPSIGPFLGMMDEVAAKHPVRNRWVFNAAMWWLRRFLPSWRPGWNDYWMMRWQLSHSEAAAVEIHQRAWHSFLASDMLRPMPQPELERLHAVWESARWMVGSYRRQDPEFHASMLKTEKECEVCNANKIND